MKKLKIAIYTIAKNEEGFVEKWYNSSREADYHLILDTGSTDKTVEVARRLGIRVEEKAFTPWRFDHARNYALSLLPDDIDICLALDMDEVLVEGWRAHLENIPDNVTRPRYKYVWSWNSNGTEGLTYGGDKAHRRHGYAWKHPVHETLKAINNDEVQHWIGMEVHHRPDLSKPRSQYLPLLKLAIEEDPDDARNSFYYARELFFYKQYEESIVQFNRYLSLPTTWWAPERAKAMRYLYEITNDHNWLWKATQEAPTGREGWVQLAQYGYDNSDWYLCFYASGKALAIIEKPLEYLNEDFAWRDLPHDLHALSSHHLGWRENAIMHGKLAIELNPGDIRLQNNLRFYES